MLILSLTAVARGPVHLQAAIPAEHPLWSGTGIRLDKPLQVDLQANGVGSGVLVRGEMSTQVAAECRRCVAPLSVAVRHNVDVLYEPLSEEEIIELGGEVYPLPDRGDDLDLKPALREQLILRVPDYVLCSENCQGLCPQCGADLNQTTCECVPEAQLGPWSALKSVKFE
jgi:uncharacterized protein